jgi:hypothetical protein
MGLINKIENKLSDSSKHEADKQAAKQTHHSGTSGVSKVDGLESNAPYGATGITKPTVGRQA